MASAPLADAAGEELLGSGSGKESEDGDDVAMEEVEADGPPVLDPMFTVGKFLKGLYEHPALTLEEIAKAIGEDEKNLQRSYDILRKQYKNLEINTDLQDGTNAEGKLTLRYNVKYPVYSKEAVKDLVNKRLQEIEIGDNGLGPSYLRCRYDVADLLSAGHLIGVDATGKKETLLSRPTKYLSLLPGKAIVKRGSRFVETTMDIRPDIRRGDALRFGEEGDNYYRISVSTKTKKRSVFSHKLSVTSGAWTNTTETKPRYVFPYNACILSLDRPYSGAPSEEPLSVYKYGVSNEFRKVWYEMCDLNDWPKDKDAMLEAMKVEELDVEGDAGGAASSASRPAARRPRAGRKKRRRR